MASLPAPEPHLLPVDHDESVLRVVRSAAGLGLRLLGTVDDGADRLAGVHQRLRARRWLPRPRHAVDEF